MERDNQHYPAICPDPNKSVHPQYLNGYTAVVIKKNQKKVVITRLGKSFYSKRYKGARRVTS